LLVSYLLAASLIHYFGARGYRWVLDADIEAAFDNLSHSARLWSEGLKLTV
jgi:retron-type reverse transcriptase